MTILYPPEGYIKALSFLIDRKTIVNRLKNNTQFIQAFYLEKEELIKDFPKLKQNLAKKGALWICWPKAAAKMATDLNENLVQQIGLKNGLVDIKVIAVDEIWSGLKFVYRLEDR